MDFSGSNFGRGIQSNLGNYLNGSSQLSRIYPSQQGSAYPLFHPAAMAAVAAAAAGYSQLGSRTANYPLNLTALQGSRPYSFYPSDMNRSSYYQNFALQNSGAYQGPSPNPYSFPFSYSSTPSGQATQCSGNTRPFLGYPPDTLPQSTTAHSNHLGTVGRSVPEGAKSHGSKTTAKSSRNKKGVNAEELESRKRQEFDELAKARTEKLFSDGPLYTPPSGSGPLSSSSSAGSACLGTSGPEDNSPNYKKLIEAVLDAKKSALLRSPAVVAYLEGQQRSLEEFKRQNELFRVEMGK
ncbi:unnamed protein product [Calicophoron daubneyi]|uniref:Regulatory factor X-associated protein RFXANK-binding domain-containing protein n=1 Tax=Calicophoron daubneyi TaxID=300641 RepID=A0AAV2T3N9_CALDB